MELTRHEPPRAEERPPSPEAFDVIVIGAGQAGLSLGHHLASRGLRFVVLDAGARIGDQWRQRWDSLRLFTPARFDGLDGLPFPAPPDSFPTKDEMADYLEAYAAHFALPVRTGVRVDRVWREETGTYVVNGNGRELRADHVVVAMANYQRPRVPDFARQLRRDIVQLHSADYRNLSQLQEGSVLLVGAGNSGSEIARELAGRHRVLMSGRDTGHIPFRIEGFAGRVLLVRLVLKGLFHHVLTVGTPIGRRVRPHVLSQGGPLIRVKPKDLAAAGVDTLLVRERELDDRDLLALMRSARAAYPGPGRLLGHRRFDIALAAGADGVHLPADGLPVPPVREATPSSFLVGRSTHTSDEIDRAAGDGAGVAVDHRARDARVLGDEVGREALRGAEVQQRHAPARRHIEVVGEVGVGLHDAELEELPEEQPLQHGEHRWCLLRLAPVRDGDAEEALFELRRAVEALHPVVRQGAAELVEKGRRQAGTPRVEVAQEGEEVLLGAVALILLLHRGAPGRVAAEERGEVHEGLEDLQLARVGLGAVRRGSGADRRDQPAHSGGVDVVAEEQPVKLFEPLAAAGGGIALRQSHRRERGKAETLAGRRFAHRLGGIEDE